MASKKAVKPLSILQDNFGIYEASGELWIVDLSEVADIQAGKMVGELSFYKKQAGEVKMRRFLEASSFDSDPKNLISQFWLSPKTRVFKQTAFSPEKTDIATINFWVGNVIAPKQGDWSQIHQFLEGVICGGDKEVSNYLLSYLAHMIQCPEEKPGIMVVLLGSQGTGKGTFFNLLRRLWPRTTLQVGDIDQIVGTFNASLERNYIVCMDEALFAGDRKKLDRLKSLVTEPVCRIEQKYQPSRTIDSYHRFFAASNSEQFAHIERDDRRFLFLRVADSKKCDTDYFSHLHKQMENPLVISAMLYDLINLDISSFNIRRRPATNEHLNQKLQSLTGFERFWFEILQSGCLTGSDISSFDEWVDVRFVPTHTLITNFKNYDKHSERYGTFQSRAIATHLEKYCPSAKSTRGKSSHSKQVRGYDLPALQVARAEFQRAIGGEIDWGDSKVAAIFEALKRGYLIDEGAHP
jgi:hypothetical protein